MIDFDTLQLQPAEADHNAYVGLIIKGGEPILRLPLGCTNLIKEIYNKSGPDRFNSVRELYFILYGALRTFSDIANSMTGKVLQDITSGRSPQRGGKMIEKHRESRESPIVLFSQLDSLYGVLELRDEPSLMSLISKFGKSSPRDLNNFHQHLGSATFSDGDIAIIDEARTPRNAPAACGSDLIRLCCFILLNVSDQLDEKLPGYVLSLSEEYREKHLQVDANLFDPRSWRDTRQFLRDHLEIISRSSHVKDDDFYTFFDAADFFLNGSARKPSDQEVWGITGFSQVWEAACIEYAASSAYSILYADTSNLVAARARSIRSNPNNPKLQEALSPLRPDAVCRSKDNSFVLIDAKYKSSLDYSDYVKQFVYEWAVSRCGATDSADIQNEFWLPNTDTDTKEVDTDLLVSDISDYLAEKKSALSSSLRNLFEQCITASSADLGRPLKLTNIKFKIVYLNISDVLLTYSRAHHRN